MKKKAFQQNEQTQDVRFSPTLDAAIAAWKKVRREFENERSKNRQDAYMKATDELGQSISQSGLSNSALAEQVGLECWSAGEHDGVSGHGRC
jgi:hypothetical protein